MKRRTLLRALPAAGAAALTGCLADGADEQPADASDPDTTDLTATPAPTDAPGDTDSDERDDVVTEPGGSGTPGSSETPGSPRSSETPTRTPPSTTPSGIADRSLSVLDAGCGTTDDDASIAFGTDDEVVTVTGTIWGNDACHTAVLSDARLDGGTLTVVVGSERDADPETACADCIVSIGYEATVTFPDGLPAEVAVVHAHDGEDTRVASTRR